MAAKGPAAAAETAAAAALCVPRVVAEGPAVGTAAVAGPRIAQRSSSEGAAWLPVVVWSMPRQARAAGIGCMAGPAGSHGRGLPPRRALGSRLRQLGPREERGREDEKRRASLQHDEIRSSRCRRKALSTARNMQGTFRGGVGFAFLTAKNRTPASHLHTPSAPTPGLTHPQGYFLRSG